MLQRTPEKIELKLNNVMIMIGSSSLIGVCYRHGQWTLSGYFVDAII